MAVTKTVENDVSGHPMQINYKLSGGMKITLKYMEDVDSEPSTYFDVALDTLDKAVISTTEIRNNPLLSELGKSDKVAPIFEDLIRTISGSSFMLDEFERRVALREKALVRAPSLEPTHSAAAAEDVEIRIWWRAQSRQDRLQMIGKFASDPETQRIQIALLRSPIALVDTEAQLIATHWADAKRAEQPAEAAFIDVAKASIEWARRGLAHVVGIAITFMQLIEQDILKIIVTSPAEGRQRGYKAFGFSDHKAAEMKRYLDIRAGRKAA